MRYNIYAGLGGGFGGATYRGTGNFNSRDSAEKMAYQYAVEEYEMYEGLHGIRSWADIADEEGLDYEEDEYEINEMYDDERESWMEYYAVLTEEDDLEGEEITGL
jgi:hypothetical protein